LAAHTMLGKKYGFTDEQIIEIRRGHASFDTKLDALARFAKGITQSRGHIDQVLVEAFFAAGWTKENLVDAIVLIGDKTVSNYLHSTTKIPVDFPAVPKLD
jgi:alkylhydroperoxidase family enzyme